MLLILIHSLLARFQGGRLRARLQATVLAGQHRPSRCAGTSLHLSSCCGFCSATRGCATRNPLLTWSQPGCAWASGHVDQGGGGPGANEGGAAVPTSVAQHTCCSVGSGFEADVVVRSSIRSSPGAWPTTSAGTGSTKCSPTSTTERRSPVLMAPHLIARRSED